MENNLTAAEMFAKLGFKRKERKSYIRYEQITKCLEVIRIEFWKRIKLVEPYIYDLTWEERKDYGFYYEEFLAIQKQIEELGWDQR